MAVNNIYKYFININSYNNMLTEVCLKIVESMIVEPSSVNIHLIRIRSTVDRPYYGECFFFISAWFKSTYDQFSNRVQVSGFKSMV